jgi:fructose-bisphosphate aldolase class I
VIVALALARLRGDLPHAPASTTVNEDPMDKALLSKTAAAMVAHGKGILAADESSGTCETRFKSVNVECTEENRRTYRGLLFGTPGVEQFVSGVILFDETLRQKADDGTLFPQYLANKGIIPGIKVDKGLVDIPFSPGEKVTEGLDGLPKRMAEYFQLGARFAKWRAVITIGDSIPSHTCLYANAHALARYAAVCQAASIVPMIEPEVLLTGSHTAERCEEVTEAGLRATYAAMAAYNVSLEHLILKTSMVVSGKDCPRQAGVDEVAERTVRAQAHRACGATRRRVPLRAVRRAATAHLNAMAAMKHLPWPLTFS